jgi:CHAD domain-containing protein
MKSQACSDSISIYPLVRSSISDSTLLPRMPGSLGKRQRLWHKSGELLGAPATASGRGHWEWMILAPGLNRTYKQGREQFATVCDDPTVENLHEWRKRAKDLRYQLRLLKQISPAGMTKLVEEAEKLGDYLSDDHGLAMFRQAAVERAKGTKDEAREVAILIALIDQRPVESKTEARFLGERIYAEKPADFMSRLDVYWRVWKAEGKSKPIAPHGGHSTSCGLNRRFGVSKGR